MTASPELQAVDRWLVWRPMRNEDGRFDKVPVDKNWPTTSRTYQQAVNAAKAWPDARLGFVFSDADDIGGVDLDCVRDPATGEIIAPWARDIIAAFGPTYIEVKSIGHRRQVVGAGLSRQRQGAHGHAR